MKNLVNRCFGVAVLAGVLAVAMSARADTLLWYRFDGDGATIENKAAPGTMDGTLKSINTWGSLGGLGDTTAKFPKRGDAFPEGTRIIDPATDAVVSGTVKSLSFSGDANNSGIVLLSKADASSLVALKRFTCEAFFRIPSAALDRSADALFPIVEFGTDKNTNDNQGWKLGFFLQRRQDVRLRQGRLGKGHLVSECEPQDQGCARPIVRRQDAVSRRYVRPPWA